MKPQDILFILALLFLFWKQNPKWFVFAGLVCLVFALPFFAFWVFFTAERLVYYAALFFLVATIWYMLKK